jgi:L-ascorbate metabolism protein UlaG (beta-lactamase superfamily)
VAGGRRLLPRLGGQARRRRAGRRLLLTALRITHIGGPTVLIEAAGWRLLTDPTFDRPGLRYGFGWGSHSTKLAGPSVGPDQLGEIDAVLLTHDQHDDNLDPAGRELLPRAEVVVTTEPGARRLGGGARGLAPWSSTTLEAPGREAIRVTATPCRHGPPLSKPIVGEVVGFSLEWEDQRGGALWITGDTVLHRGVRDAAERLDVDVALIHLGSVRFGVTGPLRYTMTAKEAVELCGLLNPRIAIPVHYEGWSHFKQGREEMEDALAAAPPDVRDRFRWLPIGEATEIS